MLAHAVVSGYVVPPNFKSYFAVVHEIQPADGLSIFWLAQLVRIRYVHAVLVRCTSRHRNRGDRGLPTRKRQDKYLDVEKSKPKEKSVRVYKYPFFWEPQYSNRSHRSRDYQSCEPGDVTYQQNKNE